MPHFRRRRRRRQYRWRRFVSRRDLQDDPYMHVDDPGGPEWDEGIVNPYAATEFAPLSGVQLATMGGVLAAWTGTLAYNLPAAVNYARTGRVE